MSTHRYLMEHTCWYYNYIQQVLRFPPYRGGTWAGTELRSSFQAGGFARHCHGAFLDRLDWESAFCFSWEMMCAQCSGQSLGALFILYKMMTKNTIPPERLHRQADDGQTISGYRSLTQTSAAPSPEWTGPNKRQLPSMLHPLAGQDQPKEVKYMPQAKYLGVHLLVCPPPAPPHQQCLIRTPLKSSLFSPPTVESLPKACNGGQLPCYIASLCLFLLGGRHLLPCPCRISVRSEGWAFFSSAAFDDTTVIGNFLPPCFHTSRAILPSRVTAVTTRDPGSTTWCFPWYKWTNVSHFCLLQVSLSGLCPGNAFPNPLDVSYYSNGPSV